jgi:AraC family transcriptional regulator of adaptative response / DNA-3-methyladenine glycosylase II
MTNIAYTSGFNSVRRFNEVIKSAYAATPAEMRGTKITKENKKAEECSSKRSKTNTVSIHLPYRPPFD